MAKESVKMKWARTWNGGIGVLKSEEPIKKVVKFNSGVGALLCNKCKTIITTGFNHENKEHFCDKCKNKR